ncbi:MAG: nuclear transport factor 2 family protein [Mycobacterium sp.]
MHAFRSAVESGEFDTIGDIFAEDVVLHSPIAHRPYRGREMVAAIVCAVAEVLEGFRFEKEIGAQEVGDTAGDRALLFKATVGGLKIQGCDFVHTADDGLIDEITVMLRPLKAVTVFAERMSAEFEKAMARTNVAAQKGKQ